MARYGLTRSLIDSGDLRLKMASEEGSAEEGSTFKKYIAFDDLIRVSDSNILSYNEDALDSWNSFIGRVDEIRPLGLPVMHKGATCLLVGMGSSLDIKFAEEADKSGIHVISLGNAIYHAPFSSYWVGLSDVVGYHPEAVERSNVTSFIRNIYLGRALWDYSSNRMTSRKPEDYPSNIGFSFASNGADSFFENPSEVSVFNVPCSFYAGISIACCLGFRNIILDGVSLKTELSDFYYGSYIPNRKTVTKKRSVYRSVLQSFQSVYKACTERAICISSLGESPFDIPSYTSEYLLDVFRKQRFISAKSSIQNALEMSIDAIQIKAAKEKKYTNATLLPKDISDVLEHFISISPELFDNDTVRVAIDAIKKADKQGGCSSCKKNSIVRPIYTLLEKLALEDLDRFELAWKKLFPDKWVIQIKTIPGEHHGKRIIRSDKSDT